MYTAYTHSVYNVYMRLGLTARRIAAAARRLLDREGAEAVTLRRVASAAGITPMAVYRHYAGREGLLTALAEEGFQELADRLAAKRWRGDTRAQLRQMADIYLDHALEKPRLFELMFLKPRASARRYPRDFRLGGSPTANLMVDAVKQGMANTELRKDDAWEIVFEMGALSHGLIVLYLGGRIATSEARFRALYRRSFRRFFHGICR